MSARLRTQNTLDDYPWVIARGGRGDVLVTPGRPCAPTDEQRLRWQEAEELARVLLVFAAIAKEEDR
jgi:hypothetical protein